MVIPNEMIANWTFPYLKIQNYRYEGRVRNWLITEVRELVLLLDCAQYPCKLGLSNSGEDSHFYETGFIFMKLVKGRFFFF